jgi:hypothetical protein
MPSVSQFHVARADSAVETSDDGLTIDSAAQEPVEDTFVSLRFAWARLRPAHGFQVSQTRTIRLASLLNTSANPESYREPVFRPAVVNDGSRVHLGLPT